MLSTIRTIQHWGGWSSPQEWSPITVLMNTLRYICSKWVPVGAGPQVPPARWHHTHTRAHTLIHTRTGTAQHWAFQTALNSIKILISSCQHSKSGKNNNKDISYMQEDWQTVFVCDRECGAFHGVMADMTERGNIRFTHMFWVLTLH